MNWIRTSQRLPVVAKGVDRLLYCADTGEQFVGEHLGGGFFAYAVDRHGERIVCRPTHWQPLPEPPSDERREG